MRASSVSSVVISVAFLSCATSPPPPPATTAPPLASATAEPPKVAPPPASSAPPPAPPPPPPARPLEIRTADATLAFLAAVCDHAKQGDARWVKEHVEAYLPGNVWVNDGGGDPLVGSRIGEEGPAAIERTPLCAHPPTKADDLRGFTFDGKRAVAHVALEGREHRVVLETSDAGPRLVELSFELPPPPRTTKKPKKHEHTVQGRVLNETDRDGGPVEAMIVATLRKDPSCTWEHAMRSEDSGSFGVAVRKEDGRDLDVKVYASTVVPASWVSCLERQLSSSLGKLFRGKAFAVQVHLMIGIPTKARPGDDAVILESGPPR